MRTFEEFPEQATCPICKTNNNSECILIPVGGTTNGNICEAKPVHTVCLYNIIDKLTFLKDESILYVAV